MTAPSSGSRDNERPNPPSSRGRLILYTLLFLVVVVGTIVFFLTRTMKSPTTMASSEPLDGRLVYQAQCAMCHQDDGKGVADAYPPLVGSEYIDARPAMLASMVLHGMQGPMTVAGVKYNGLMPGKKEVMSSAEIAAAITYVRATWGRSSRTAPPLTAEMVDSVKAATATRAAPWTANDLPPQ